MRKLFEIVIIIFAIIKINTKELELYDKLLIHHLQIYYDDRMMIFKLIKNQRKLINILNCEYYYSKQYIKNINNFQ